MKRIYAILIFLLCISADYVRMPVVQQDPNSSNAKIKATFLYNFTKYIEWPEKYKEGNFVIGVLGTTSFYNELTALLSTKTVGNQKFEIKSYASIGSINGICHILFIPTENSAMLPEVLKKMKGKNTLIVTEKPGLAKQGAAINFIAENNKQRFELNKTNVEKYNLKVSSTLEALAIKIE
ncbi:MAG: YfiR family protein [Bacteroidia bacterium]